LAGSVDQLALDLAALSVRCREAGDGGALTRELSRKVREALDPLPRAVETGLKPHLPDRYATVLDEDLRFSRRSSDSPAGMRVSVDVTTPGIRRRIRRLDDGILAHPLWGNRKHWYNQPVEPGWFSGPAQDAIPRARDALEQALNTVLEKVAGQGVP
jgi:hypothetical protein